jgi:hypothetical protein
MSKTRAGGGGGNSGLGMRSVGFFGGRSGTQSSTEIIGPIIIGPNKSLERCWRVCSILSRMEEYSAADEVLEMRKKKLLGIEIYLKQQKQVKSSKMFVELRNI